MNFLAHAYLSGSDNKILVGNFIGDFIKGKQALLALEAGIAKGVEFHRAIDAYTDNHAVVHASKNRLRPKYRHYSGVIVDVFYDHFLAANWQTYHRKQLSDFAAATYTTIQSFSDILPTRFKGMFPYMIRSNWLVSYAQPEAIRRTLSGMASRTPYTSRMEEAHADLKDHYDAFLTEFEAFFPDLTTFSARWLRMQG